MVGNCNYIFYIYSTILLKYNLFVYIYLVFVNICIVFSANCGKIYLINSNIIKAITIKPISILIIFFKVSTSFMVY